MLDEPTSGLDPLVQQTFYEVIREAKAEGRTIFLSSHILSEVEKTCDRVAIIREGQLVKVDRVEALRDLAHHQVELRFAGDVPVGAFAALPGVSEVTDRGEPPPDARLGLDHAGRPRGRELRAARLRQPRAVARGDVPGAVRPRHGRGGLT
jgi:energy-coupling factor transporter ATP-binding protein EcfA2